MPVDHDYSGVNAFPHFDRITLTNANEADDMTLPDGPLLVTFHPITNACRISHAGTQGAQLTDDFFTVAGNSAYEITVSFRQPISTLYVDTASAGTVVEVELARPV
jgi:hypothetical protein